MALSLRFLRVGTICLVGTLFAISVDLAASSFRKHSPDAMNPLSLMPSGDPQFTVLRMWTVHHYFSTAHKVLVEDGDKKLHILGVGSEFFINLREGATFCLRRGLPYNAEKTVCRSPQDSDPHPQPHLDSKRRIGEAYVFAPQDRYRVLKKWVTNDASGAVHQILVNERGGHPHTLTVSSDLFADVSEGAFVCLKHWVPYDHGFSQCEVPVETNARHSP